VWRHVKNHRLGRQVITGPLKFRQQVLTAHHRLQKLTSAIRGFFYDPDLRYIL
jgi:hypothetical protein